MLAAEVTFSITVAGHKYDNLFERLQMNPAHFPIAEHNSFPLLLLDLSTSDVITCVNPDVSYSKIEAMQIRSEHPHCAQYVYVYACLLVKDEKCI